MLKKIKEILIVPPDLALFLTLIDSNYPCLELILNGPKDVRAIEVRLYVTFKSTCFQFLKHY